MSLPLILRLLVPAIFAASAILLPEDESNVDKADHARNRGRSRSRRNRGPRHSGNARELEAKPAIPPVTTENENERSSQSGPDRIRGGPAGGERSGAEIQVLAQPAPEPVSPEPTTPPIATA